jgi:hypothetical protein
MENETNLPLGLLTRQTSCRNSLLPSPLLRAALLELMLVAIIRGGRRTGNKAAVVGHARFRHLQQSQQLL